MKNNKSKRTFLQTLGSLFIVITGLFVIVTIGDTITGNVIGPSGSIDFLNIAIVFWGLLIVIAGAWIITRKDFNKSIFNSK